MNLCLERPNDYNTVEKIAYEAFLSAPHASGDEALFVHKIRSDPDFVPCLAFVATDGGQAVGSIMYLKSEILCLNARRPVLVLAQVSVLPKFQGRGIGGALINRTVEIARSMPFSAILLFGHEKYYPRFGFESAEKNDITTDLGKNIEAFMVLPLYDGALRELGGRFILNSVFNLDKAEAEEFNRRFK
jgi:predicted N-acetyltransferase YhbS